MKKYDVITLGEALIDFVPIDDSFSGTFKSVVGGAPLNVAVGLAKLGSRVGMITRLGQDPIGEFILGNLLAAGIDCAYIQRDPDRLTPITIVMPKAEDMMRYAIYRQDGSDCALDFSSIPIDLFSDTYIFHFGTLLMSSEVSAEATRQSVGESIKGGASISVDVNLRPGAWKRKSLMVDAALECVDMADIIKMTQDEADVLGFSPSLEAQKGKVVLITNGEKEASLFTSDKAYSTPSKEVDVKDVTGAGDAFTAAFLHSFLSFRKQGIKLDDDQLLRSLETAVNAGALTVQRYGGNESFPTLAELESIKFSPDTAIGKK